MYVEYFIETILEIMLEIMYMPDPLFTILVVCYKLHIMHVFVIAYRLCGEDATILRGEDV